MYALALQHFSKRPQRSAILSTLYSPRKMISKFSCGPISNFSLTLFFSCPPMGLSVCLSAGLSVFLSVYISVLPSILRLSVVLSVCLFDSHCIWLFFFLSVHLLSISILVYKNHNSASKSKISPTKHTVIAYFTVYCQKYAKNTSCFVTFSTVLTGVIFQPVSKKHILHCLC